MSDKGRLISSVYVCVFSKLKNKKITQLKTGKIFELTLHQRRYLDGKQIHEKMLNIISHKGNTN